MAPLLPEVARHFEEIERLWVRGGFPPSYVAAADDDAWQWRQDFIRHFLNVDLPALGVSAPTVNRWLDHLVDALTVRRLEPWHANLGKRLVKSPRIYLRDAGLLHALLGIRDADALAGHPAAGASWEGFVVEQICAQLPTGTPASFYRTAAGAELDLVIELYGRRIGIEASLSSAPAVTRGFWQACEDVGVHEAWVMAPVREGWPIGDRVRVISPLELPLALPAGFEQSGTW